MPFLASSASSTKMEANQCPMDWVFVTGWRYGAPSRADAFAFLSVDVFYFRFFVALRKQWQSILDRLCRHPPQKRLRQESVAVDRTQSYRPRIDRIKTRQICCLSLGPAVLAMPGARRSSGAASLNVLSDWIWVELTATLAELVPNRAAKRDHGIFRALCLTS